MHIASAKCFWEKMLVGKIVLKRECIYPVQHVVILYLPVPSKCKGEFCFMAIADSLKFDYPSSKGIERHEKRYHRLTSSMQQVP